MRTLLAVVIAFAPALAAAASPMLDEDQERRTLVLQDSFLSLGLGARAGVYAIDAEFEQDFNLSLQGPALSDGSAQTVSVFIDLHMLRSLGVSTGVILFNTGSGFEGTFDNSALEARVATDSSFMTTEWFLGIESNLIGWGATQLSAGIDMILGRDFSLVYYAGLRFDRGDFVIRPRLSYVDWQAEVFEGDRTFGQSYFYGLGASVDVVWNFSRQAP
ncbi:MAG: hypothetical protein AAF654_14860 [Myxococcota bacterium]